MPPGHKRADTQSLNEPLMTGIRRHLIPLGNHQSGKHGMKFINGGDTAFHQTLSLLFSNLVGDILSNSLKQGQIRRTRHSCLRDAIWRQTLPIKRLPEHYRIRISRDYRMIVRWLPGKLLHILDVIPRQGLESWINRHG